MTKLEFLRRNKKFSQAQLVKELGFSTNWCVNLLERHRPDPETVSESLRTSPEEYFGMEIRELLEPAELAK